MPRQATFPYTYTLPSIYLAVPGTTIIVDQHNTPLEDLAATLNTAQPINYGGTGATTAAQALVNLGGTSGSQVTYIAAGGTATVMTLTPTTPLTALAGSDGIAFPLIAIVDSTGAATMNISGTGARAVRKISGGTDVDIAAGDIKSAGRYTVEYSSTANSSAGAWVLVNPTGAGLPTGTSGGVLGFTSTTALASSVALTQHALVVGGGAGATPTPLSGLGTTVQVLHGNASGDPSFSAVAIGSDVSGLGTGIATALAVNVGTAGAPVVNGGALGTPTSGTATNLTGTAAGLTAGGATLATSTNALASATTTVNVSSATAPSSGQVLTATSSTAATWQPVSSGGMTLIATLATTSGTTVTASSIASGYVEFVLMFLGVAQSGTPFAIDLELSSDNSTFGSVIGLTASGATPSYGEVVVGNVTAAGIKTVSGVLGSNAAPSVATGAPISGAETSKTGTIQAVRLISISAFSGGSVLLYGRK